MVSYPSDVGTNKERLFDWLTGWLVTFLCRKVWLLCLVGKFSERLKTLTFDTFCAINVFLHRAKLLVRYIRHVKLSAVTLVQHVNRLFVHFAFGFGVLLAFKEHVVWPFAHAFSPRFWQVRNLYKMFYETAIFLSCTVGLCVCNHLPHTLYLTFLSSIPTKAWVPGKIAIPFVLTNASSPWGRTKALRPADWLFPAHVSLEIGPNLQKGSFRLLPKSLYNMGLIRAGFALRRALG